MTDAIRVPVKEETKLDVPPWEAEWKPPEGVSDPIVSFNTAMQDTQTSWLQGALEWALGVDSEADTEIPEWVQLAGGSGVQSFRQMAKPGMIDWVPQGGVPARATQKRSDGESLSLPEAFQGASKHLQLGQGAPHEERLRATRFSSTQRNLARATGGGGALPADNHIVLADRQPTSVPQVAIGAARQRQLAPLQDKVQALPGPLTSLISSVTSVFPAIPDLLADDDVLDGGVPEERRRLLELRRQSEEAAEAGSVYGPVRYQGLDSVPKGELLNFRALHVSRPEGQKEWEWVGADLKAAAARAVPAFGDSGSLDGAASPMQASPRQEHSPRQPWEPAESTQF